MRDMEERWKGREGERRERGGRGSKERRGVREKMERKTERGRGKRIRRGRRRRKKRGERWKYEVCSCAVEQNIPLGFAWYPWSRTSDGFAPSYQCSGCFLWLAAGWGHTLLHCPCCPAAKRRERGRGRQKQGGGKRLCKYICVWKRSYVTKSQDTCTPLNYALPTCGVIRGFEFGTLAG